MAASRKLKSTLCCLKSLLQFQLQKRFTHSSSKPPSDLHCKPMAAASGFVDRSNWKKVHSRSVGITLSMIPDSPRIILKILQSEGIFLLYGLMILVHRDSDLPWQPVPTQDICQHREKVNIISLFYDPFAQRIYDYSNGMKDLRAMKLRTLVPAHLSFEEDCARILRGIRIAARLGFSFTIDTEKAIRSLYASVMTLDKARLMMELNYMLSYGAAEPSLVLLKRFNILELLLPLQAAYLAECSGTESHTMLMKLFLNLDNMTSCDQPCNSVLWVSLLAFHLALVNNPQDAIVVWMFSSLLYHGNWREGVEAARELSAGNVHFTPEILKSLVDVTDEELSRQVANLASMVVDSIDMLTDSESLCIAMSRYPLFSSQLLGRQPISSICECHNDTHRRNLSLEKHAQGSLRQYPKRLGAPYRQGAVNEVLISKNAAKEVYAIFKVLMNDPESLREERHYYSIDYNLLGKGDIPETRFALGKIIMDTMRSGVVSNKPKLAPEKATSSIPKHETPNGKDGAKRRRNVGDDQNHQQKLKKQKSSKQTNKLEQKCTQENLEEIISCQVIAQKRQQLKKVVVKDVTKLLSLQEVTLKNVKVKTEEHHKTQGANEILDVIGKVTRIEKQCMAQSPENILSALEKVPLMNIERKEQISEDVTGVSSLSNIFKGDKYTTKVDDRKEKQAKMSDLSRNKSVGAKRVLKLSGIFK
ncbi:hypothetical protein KSS87_017917 [Heliosperma pusillum]|nr:hypothetical protein KSS87_017917 [Heliosperma pusillum]